MRVVARLQGGHLAGQLVEAPLQPVAHDSRVQRARQRQQLNEVHVPPGESPTEARRLLKAIDTGTLAGPRDRALLSVMLYSFARVSAVVGMRRADYFWKESQGWLRLQEKGGKRHDVPAHHRAAEALDDYLEAGEFDEPKASLFQNVDPAGRRLTGRELSRRLVLAMIKRRAAAPDLPPSVGLG